MKKRFYLGSLALFLCGCQTPAQVANLSSATSANIGELKQRIADFRSEAEQSAKRRREIVARLDDAALRLNLETGDTVYAWRHAGGKTEAETFDRIKKRVEEKIEASRAVASKCEPTNDKSNAQHLSKLTEASVGAAELAKSRDLGDQAKFLLTYAGEVDKDIKKRKEEAEKATASAETGPKPN